VDTARLTLTTGFKSICFEKSQITQLSEYPGFCWLFARGISIKHSEESQPPFFVFWAFDLKPIRRCLEENGYALMESDCDEI
jgi:hypothetical protein